MVPVFVINLDRSPDRLAHFGRQCRDTGIPFERFPAVDGLDLPAHLKPYFYGAPLAPAEIGCYASHLGVWQTVANRGIAAALVCEDDVQLSSTLATTISDALAVAPVGWDIIRLGKPPKRSTRTLATLSDGRQFVQFTRIPTGAYGYIVSQAGARKLLSPRKVWGPVDVEMAHAWELDLNVYGVLPPPITHDYATSVIGKRVRRSRLHRIMPTPSRIVFNARKMGAAGWARCLALNLTRKLRPRQAISP